MTSEAYGFLCPSPRLTELMLNLFRFLLKLQGLILSCFFLFSTSLPYLSLHLYTFLLTQNLFVALSLALFVVFWTLQILLVILFSFCILLPPPSISTQSLPSIFVLTQ